MQDHTCQHNGQCSEQKSLTELLDVLITEAARFYKGEVSDHQHFWDALTELRSRLAALENEAEQAAKIEEARSEAPITELREILDDLTTQFDRTRNILGEVRNIARTAHRFAEKQYRVGYNAALEEAAKVCDQMYHNPDTNLQRRGAADELVDTIRAMKKETK